MNRLNEHGQPIGPAVADWVGAQHPGHVGMEGRYCRVEPLNADKHTADLFAAYSHDKTGALWTYNFIGPFETESALRDWVQKASGVDDQPYFAIIDRTTDRAVGIASYLRIAPVAGSIEVGGITYSPLLQRQRAATETMYLMMARVFNELGYRRYEWKCDALNAPSCGAARRMGFTPEGIFRQAATYKGRNRDTAWFSLLNYEWPPVERAFTRWLAEGNFDAGGQQRQKLNDLIVQERAELTDAG
ncbi:GNAT family N-acetyltransferase [Roseovarius sp. EL26]|uniref:GNAT family N-acetyltransferase n=1 Tax=Roseovarius sp. EL26 TaxID=2126672 RepID=UPI000EA1E930|nr:GNAT family protein [Roseovarius sp. EL26]